MRGAFPFCSLIVELMRGAGLPAPRQVRVSGGGARSPLWRQIIADVVGSDDLVARIHRTGQVLDTRHTEQGTELRVRVGEQLAAELENFLAP